MGFFIGTIFIVSITFNRLAGMDINTNWGGVPTTNSNATIKSFRRCVGVLAIRVKSASIRNAEVTGVFELADTPQPFGVFNGVLRAEVKCTWFDRNPPTSWTHIQLLDSWELIRNYSGEVADNIA